MGRILIGRFSGYTVPPATGRENGGAIDPEENAVNPNLPDPRATSQKEFVSLVEQALSEVEDLREVLHFSGQPAGETFIDRLEKGLLALQQALADGAYRSEDRDLPFMDAVNEAESMLPFRHLLLRINATHRKGINTP